MSDVKSLLLLSLTQLTLGDRLFVRPILRKVSDVLLSAAVQIVSLEKMFLQEATYRHSIFMLSKRKGFVENVGSLI